MICRQTEKKAARQRNTLAPGMKREKCLSSKKRERRRKERGEDKILIVSRREEDEKGNEGAKGKGARFRWIYQTLLKEKEGSERKKVKLEEKRRRSRLTSSRT